MSTDDDRNKAQRVQAFEDVCGPWFVGDLPEDIVCDIRLCDPSAR